MKDVVFAAGITSPEHESALREAIGPHCEMVNWEIGDENPDMEQMIDNWSTQGAALMVVDEAGLPFKEVSRPDIVGRASGNPDVAARLLVVLDHEAEAGDPFVGELIGAGVTRLVLPRYGWSREELVGQISRLAASRRTAEEARAYVESLPSPTKSGRFARLGGKGRPEAAEDLLAAQPEATGPEGAEMAEVRWMSEKLGLYVGEEALAAADEQLAMESSQHDAGRGPAIDPVPAPSCDGARPVAQAEPPSRAPQDARAEKSPSPGDAVSDAIDLIAQAVSRGDVTAGEARKRLETLTDAIQEAEERRRARLTFSVAGIAPNVGTTHLAIDLALQLAAEGGGKVACVLSDRTEFNDLTALDGFEPGPGGAMTLRGVDFLFMSRDGWPAGYDLAVADCGTLAPNGPSPAAGMFSTASRKLIALSGSPWKNVRELVEAVPGLQGGLAAEAIWCFFASSPEYVEFARQLGSKAAGRSIKTFTVPYRPSLLSGKRVPDAWKRITENAFGKGKVSRNAKQ